MKRIALQLWRLRNKEGLPYKTWVRIHESMWRHLEPNNLHRCRELTQSFVEVVHLCKNADSYENCKDICRGLFELVITAQSEFYSNSDCLDSHHADGPDHRAYWEIYQRVFPSVLRSDFINHNYSKNCNWNPIEKESYRTSVKKLYDV